MRGRAVGEWGERLAARHLEAQGLLILARNWRTRGGEVDLVAQDGDTIVFVEVKTRTSDAFGAPEEAVTGSKQRRILRAAQAYLVRHDMLEASWRVDVVAVERNPAGGVRRLEHFIDVVDGPPAVSP